MKKLAAGPKRGLPSSWRWLRARRPACHSRRDEARACCRRLQVRLLAQMLRRFQVSAQRCGALLFLDGGCRIVHGEDYARPRGGCLEGFA
jgi:hypothetical protein